MKTLKLSSGAEMPAFGLGTWKAPAEDVARAVLEAVRAGYRHLDCAWIYGNEEAIGTALRTLFDEGTVTREELWITSKLWNDFHAAVDVEPSLRESLDRLQLDYLDLYLIHWPIAHRRGCTMPKRPADLLSLEDHPISETWGALEKCVEAGLCRNIGVSNFSRDKLAALLDSAQVPPAVNQVELHPYLQQTELLAFARERGVVLTAYAPLGSQDRPDIFRSDDDPVLLDDPALHAIAKRHDVTPAQVLIAWALKRGTAVIPKSAHPERIRENLAATSIRLGEDDMAQLNDLDRHRRYLDGSVFLVEGGPYTYANLWDEAPPG